MWAVTAIGSGSLGIGSGDERPRIRQTLRGRVFRLPQLFVAHWPRGHGLAAQSTAFRSLTAKAAAACFPKGQSINFRGRPSCPAGMHRPSADPPLRPGTGTSTSCVIGPAESAPVLIGYLPSGFPERQSVPFPEYLCLSLAGSILSQGSSGPNFPRSRRSAPICNRLTAILSAEPTRGSGGRRSLKGSAPHVVVSQSGRHKNRTMGGLK